MSIQTESFVEREGGEKGGWGEGWGLRAVFGQNILHVIFFYMKLYVLLLAFNIFPPTLLCTIQAYIL